MLWDPPQVRLVCFLMIRLGQLLQRLLSNDDFLIPLLPYSFIDSHQYRFVELVFFNVLHSPLLLFILMLESSRAWP